MEPKVWARVRRQVEVLYRELVTKSKPQSEGPEVGKSHKEIRAGAGQG